MNKSRLIIEITDHMTEGKVCETELGYYDLYIDGKFFYSAVSYDMCMSFFQGYMRHKLS